MSFLSNISSIFKPSREPVEPTNTGVWSDIKGTLGDFTSGFRQATADAVGITLIKNNQDADAPRGQSLPSYPTRTPIITSKIPKPSDPIVENYAKGALPDLLKVSIINPPPRKEKVDKSQSSSWIDKILGRTSKTQSSTKTTGSFLDPIAKSLRDGLVAKIEQKFKDTSTDTRIVPSTQTPLIITTPQPRPPTILVSNDKSDNPTPPPPRGTVTDVVRDINIQRISETTRASDSGFGPTLPIGLILLALGAILFLRGKK